MSSLFGTILNHFWHAGKITLKNFLTLKSLTQIPAVSFPMDFTQKSFNFSTPISNAHTRDEEEGEREEWQLQT